MGITGKASLQAFDEFPSLLQHHMIQTYPFARFGRWDMRIAAQRAELRTRIVRSRIWTDMLASSYQTASASIEEIMARREIAIIDELSGDKLDEVKE